MSSKKAINIFILPRCVIFPNCSFNSTSIKTELWTVFRDACIQKVNDVDSLSAYLCRLRTLFNLLCMYVYVHNINTVHHKVLYECGLNLSLPVYIESFYLIIPIKLLLKHLPFNFS